jgi:glutaredoxin
VTKVVVYHAAGCHLCERVLAQVRELQPALGFELREIDIAGDASLEAQHREWLPVVEIDGRRRFTYHLHVDAFTRAVGRAAGES